MGRLCLPVALALLAGCGSATAPNVSASANAAQDSARSTPEAALAAITDRCGLPRTALRSQGGLLVLNPPMEAGQTKMDCLLREISANPATANLQLGFIGNEYSEGNNVQSR